MFSPNGISPETVRRMSVWPSFAALKTPAEFHRTNGYQDGAREGRVENETAGRISKKALSKQQSRAAGAKARRRVQSRWFSPKKERGSRQRESH